MHCSAEPDCNKSLIIAAIVHSACSSVIGALIGKQEGRNIEVMNSFELLSHAIDDRVHIDKEYYYIKEEQCRWFVSPFMIHFWEMRLSWPAAMKHKNT